MQRKTSAYFILEMPDLVGVVIAPNVQPQWSVCQVLETSIHSGLKNQKNIHGKIVYRFI